LPVFTNEIDHFVCPGSAGELGPRLEEVLDEGYSTIKVKVGYVTQCVPPDLSCYY